MKDNNLFNYYIKNTKESNKHMEGIYAHADLIKVYKAILDATQEIANYLRYHSGKYSS